MNNKIPAKQSFSQSRKDWEKMFEKMSADKKLALAFDITRERVLTLIDEKKYAEAGNLMIKALPPARSYAALGRKIELVDTSKIPEEQIQIMRQLRGDTDCLLSKDELWERLDKELRSEK